METFCWEGMARCEKIFRDAGSMVGHKAAPIRQADCSVSGSNRGFGANLTYR